MLRMDENKPKPKVKRPGSGRTKGAFSFVRIPLSEILSKFSDVSTPITVGRVWAEACGFDIQKTVNANELYNKIQGQTPNTKVGVKTEEL
jgi:hypothetical protein